MKLIMESWRQFLIEGETFILTEGERIKAQEFVAKIKRGLVAVAAKKAGAEAWDHQFLIDRDERGGISDDVVHSRNGMFWRHGEFRLRHRV